MITCRKLSKKYDDRTVLNNFNYVFKQTGMYLLFGRSGSGKTTLLNLITGLINFDSGSIEFDFLKKPFIKQVDNKVVADKIAYISQNTYFVDYLTILDNLKLCTDDFKKITSLLDEFQLTNIIEKYPHQISGGERQRLAIIQALLSEKEIFLLDEPTASLDKENKMIIFEMLSLLKKKFLIIVSSHDVILKNYCDEEIDFEHLQKYEKNNIEPERKRVKKEASLRNRRNKNDLSTMKLLKYMKQEFKYSNFEKRSSFILWVIFTFSILICFICSSPKEKLLTNIDQTYKVNQFQMYCNDQTEKECNKVKNNDLVQDIIVDYARNLPREGISDGIGVDYDYETSLLTLPYDSSLFKLSDQLLYGSYYKEKNDILLTYEYALSIATQETMENLIGKQLTLKLRNGNEKFTIRGIFSEFDKKEYTYFLAQGITLEGLSGNIFLNSKFTEDYFEFRPTYYVVFFKNFVEMNRVYEQYYNPDYLFIEAYENSFYALLKTFKTLALVLYPLGIAMLFLSLLFYFQTEIIKLEHAKYNYCVYNYYGYSLAMVTKGYIFATVYHLLRILLLSFGTALTISIIFNWINSMSHWIDYQLFSLNYLFAISFILLVLLISVLISLRVSRKIKKMGWYTMLQESRDLL